MKQRLIQELKLFLRELVVQFYFAIFGKWQPPRFVLRKLGLTPREIHIIVERGKMTKHNYALWFEILKRDRWKCQRCHIRNFENKELFKPKMQVDHVQAVYFFGKSERSNLQVLCAPCNKQKGVNTIKY